jgi:SSS family solute:Na+ symporter
MTWLWTLLAVAVVLAVVLPGFSRRPTAAGFFLSRRDANTPTVAASLVATCLGASATIGMVGRAYTLGWPAFWWLGAGAIGLALLGLVWGPSMRADVKVRTLPEWAETAYGAPARILASALIAVMWVAVIAAQWVATAGVMKALFGVPMNVGIGLAAGVVSAYTAWGGQPSVLRTDRVQVVFIAAAVVIPLFFLGRLVPPEPATSAAAFAPTSPLQLVAVLIVVGGMYVVGPDLCSRVLVARDRTAIRRGALWAALGVGVAGVLVTFIGVSIRQAGVQLDSARDALPWLLAKSGAIPLPAGYLINAGLLAATLSSADTCLITVASVLELDLWGRRHDEQRHRLLGRCFVVLAGVLAAGVAWWNPRIIPNLLLAYAFYSGGLLMPLLLLRFPRVAKGIPQPWVWLAMAGGGGLPICLLLRKTVTDFAIAGLWGCLLSAIILLLGWLASLFGDQKTV